MAAMPDLPPPDPTLEVQLASQGISKGLRQTDGAQWLVRGELAFGPALIGANARNVTAADREGEFAGFLGWRGSMEGFLVEAIAAAKFALDPHGPTRDYAFEATATVTRALGALTPRITLVWSPDDFGSTRQTLFAEAGASLRLSSRLGVGAFAGGRARSGGPDYAAWNVGLTWRPLRRVTLDLRYYETDRGIGGDYRARLVGVLRLHF
jgi:hypothetical protein